jgi:hypothetical protein
MSADKERSLARRVAWLRRLCGRGPDGFVADGAMALQCKHGHALTDDVARLVADGHATIAREGGSGGRKASGKRTNVCRATVAGAAFLTGTVARKGEDFGPMAMIYELDPRARRKVDVTRSVAAWSPEAAERRAAIKARVTAFRAAVAAAKCVGSSAMIP